MQKKEFWVQEKGGKTGPEHNICHVWELQIGWYNPESNVSVGAGGRRLEEEAGACSRGACFLCLAVEFGPPSEGDRENLRQVTRYWVCTF